MLTFECTKNRLNHLVGNAQAIEIGAQGTSSKPELPITYVRVAVGQGTVF
jgi:hypothetical protein